jgi:hypothetical protein
MPPVKVEATISPAFPGAVDPCGGRYYQVDMLKQGSAAGDILGVRISALDR